MGEDIFKCTTNKGWVSKIYKDLLIHQKKKKNNPVKKWTKDINTHLTKEGIQMKVSI